MLYIIRHGKTDWNAAYKLQGSTDIPLNEEGRQMAKKAHEEYKDIHFDICFCSPLSRARQTAEILLKGREVPIIIDNRLREMSFGIYEGVENTYDHPEYPTYVLFHDPANYKGVKGGETFEELFARTGDFLRSVCMPLVKEGKDVLIVGHGAMNSSIISQMKHKERKDFWSDGIPNCKLFKLC